MIKNVSPKAARRKLAQIRPYLAELIDILGQLEQTGQDELTAQDLIDAIGRYGVTVNRYANFTIDQLQRILNAIETVARRLADELGNCACYTGPVLTPQDVFQRVYGHHPLELRYEPSESTNGHRTYASVDNSNEDIQYMTLVPDTFSKDPSDPARTKPDSPREPYDDPEIIERIVIHELGHAFHNELLRVQGDALDYEFDNNAVQVEERLNSAGRPTALIVVIPRIEISDTVYTNMRVTVPADTPMVIMDYLIETGGYYSGTDFDDGSASGALYTAEDAAADETIVLLTNLIFQEYIGPTTCDEDCGNREYLVNLTGECLLNNGRCISPEDDYQGKIYVRIPQTYKPGRYKTEVITEPILRNFFSNEQGNTSVPHPKEGFADTFAFHMVEDARNIADDSRGAFFVRNFCDWLCVLIEGVA